MGLFDVKKRERSVDAMSSAELGARITEKKKEIEQLKVDIEFAKSENEKLEDSYLRKIKDLDEKQAYFNSQIEEQRSAYNSRIEKLEIKKASYKRDYDEKVESLNDKLKELEDKEKELYASKDEMSAKAYKTKQDAVKVRIAKVKEDLKNYNDVFNKNIEDANEKYNELLSKKDKELDALNKKKNEFIVSANNEIDKLEQEKQRIENYHSEQLKRLQEEQVNVENIVKAQEENDIRVKEKELASINDEIKSLQNFRNSLLIDLDNTRLAHEREYNIIVSKYDNEKENLLRDNNLLKSELEEKQRKYDEEVKNNKISYDYQVNEINKLIASLDENASEVKTELDEKAGKEESDLARQFRNFINDLENQYKIENKAREEELASLQFELKQEEEKAKNEKAYLDNKLENANVLYKNNLKEKVDQLAEAQKTLNNLETEHNNLVKNFYDKIAVIKQENNNAITSKNKENVESLNKLKEEYETKRAAINREIDVVKENVTKVKENVAKAQKELEEYKETKELEKKQLLSEHETYVANQQRVSKEIGSKIEEVKNLIANNTQKYNESLERLNKKKSDAVNAAEIRITDLNNEYQNTIQQLKSDYDRKVDEVSKQHESRISSLTKEYNKKIEEVNSAIDAKQKDLDFISADNENKMEELRVSSERKIADLTSRNEEITRNIDAIKAKMSEETLDYDKQVKELENDYLIALDTMSKTHNDNVQRVLNEYENIPNSQLNAIKAEYDRANKEYNEAIESLQANKRRLDETESDLKYQLKNQKESLDNELFTKNNEYDRIKREAENQKSQQLRDITRITGEVENYIDEKKAKVDELSETNNDAYNRYSNELNEKFRNLSNTLKEKQENLKKQYDENYKNAQFDINNRIANINSLIKDVNDKRIAFENQYSDMYTDALNTVNTSKATLDELNTKRNEALEKYAVRLNEIKSNNNDVISNKKREYAGEIDNLKREYEIKRKDIFESISEVKTDIENINSKISVANRDFESYKQENEKHVTNINREFEEFLTFAKKSKNEIDSNISYYKQLIVENKEKYESDIRDLDNKREETRKNYERVCEDLKLEYEKRVKELENSHDSNVENVKNEHNNVINEYQNEYNRKVAEIKGLYDQKNAEYIGVRDGLQGALDSIKDEYENKIRTINEQRANLDDSIANLRSTIDNEKDKYYNTIKALEVEQQTKLADMAKQYNVDLDKVIEENYNVPNRELRENNDRLNSIQREYNARLDEIQNAKKEMDGSIFSLESHNSMERKTIESEITTLNSELDRTKAEYETVYAALNTDYNRHQKDLDEYKQDIARLVAGLKETKNNEEAAYIKNLNDDFEAVKKKLAEEETDEKNRLEDEYNALNIDLIAKKNNLDALMEELEKRKQSSLEDYTIQYDRLAKDAEEGRKQLIELQKEHDDRIPIYKNNIVELNKQHAIAIEEKNKEYKEGIERAKIEYASRRKVIEEEIVQAKANTEEINQKLFDVNRDFDKFTEESNARRQSIIDAHNDYINNSNEAINTVVNNINEIKAAITEKQQDHNREIEKINLKRKDIQEGYNTNVDEVNRLFKSRVAELDYNQSQKVAESEEAHKHVLADLRTEYDEKVKEIEDSFEQKKDEYRILKKNYKRDLEAIKDDAQKRLNNMEEHQLEIEKSVNNLKSVMEDEKNDYELQVKSLNDDAASKISEMERIHNEAIAAIVNENETVPTRSLEEVRSQLDLTQKEYDNRMLQISKNKKDLDNTELAITAKCNEERNNVDTALALRNEEYVKLKNERERLFVNFDNTLKDRQAELDSFNKDINIKTKQYRDEKEALFLRTVKEHDEQLVDIKNAHALKEQSIQSNYNNDINNLKNSYVGKIASVDHKINKILDEQNKKRDDYEAIVTQKTNDYNEIMPLLSKELEELTVQRQENIENYKVSLEKIEKENHQSVNKRRKDLDVQLDEARENYANESENIAKNTEGLRKQIEKVNKNLERSNKEYEAYKLDSENRNRKVLEEQDEYLKSIAKQKNSVEEKINVVNADIADKQNWFKREMDSITVKRNEVQGVYDTKVGAIEKEYQDRIAELNKQHNDTVTDARNKHEVKLVELQNEFTNRANEIRNSFEDKKAELKNLKATNRDTIDKIKQSVNDKIAELKNQQDELIGKINEVKQILKSENIEFNDRTKELQQEFDNQIAILSEENKKKIQDIYHSYVEIPNIEYQRVNDELNSRQAEYDNTVKEFEIKKAELDAHEKNVILKYQAIREEAKQGLASKQKQYDDTYNRLKSGELELDGKLSEEKKKVEELQIDLDNAVNEIRQEKNKSLEEHTKKLEIDYEEKEKHFKEIQDSTAKRNESELNTLREHLEAKKVGIDSLVNEIYSRRKKVEEEKNAIYNVSMAETNKLQKELDDIVSESSLKKTEYENELASKKKEYEESIENLKKKNSEELEIKKQEFIEAKKEKEKEIDEIQHKIVELSSMRDETSEKLVSYEKEKNASVESINKDLETFTMNVNRTMSELAIKRSQLEKSHNDRIIEIKTEIAQAISEYDDLMKLKPQVISDANAEEIDFAGVAKQFKDKLENLERSHMAIMDELDAKRLQTIEAITTEIAKIEETKPEKLQKYEDEIVNLSLTYDAMLKEERNKQTNLTKDIEIANKERQRLEEDTYKERDSLDRAYTDRETYLNKEFRAKLEESNSEYAKMSEQYQAQFNDLAKKRDYLSDRLIELNNGFVKADNEIHREILNLKSNYNSKLVDIQRQYEATVSFNREKLKEIDVMSSDSRNLLFKN